MSVLTHYAFRSLKRSTTRTLLSLIGVALGCAIGLVAMAWLAGKDQMMVRSNAFSGAGHAQVLPQGWSKTRDFRLRLSENWPEILAEVRQHQGVSLATPQVSIQALLGMGTRVQSVVILGVDPEFEPGVRRTVRTLAEGRYLQAGEKDAIVLGAELATRLKAEVGDELVVTSVSPSGDLNSALLNIVGLVKTGSESIDATTAQVVLEKAVELSGRPGISRIVVLGENPEHLSALTLGLKEQLLGRAEVLDWLQVSPEFNAARQSDAGFSRLVIGVLVLLVVLGITSAQLTSILQRRREFSVLLALGMKRRSLMRLIFTEALFLGLFGGVCALLFAAPFLYYLSVIGIDIAQFVGEGNSMSMSGVLFDPVLKAQVSPELLFAAFLLSIGSTVCGALYPALYSRRLNPASALRGRN